MAFLKGTQMLVLFHHCRRRYCRRLCRHHQNVVLAAIMSTPEMAMLTHTQGSSCFLFDTHTLHDKQRTNNNNNNSNRKNSCLAYASRAQDFRNIDYFIDCNVNTFVFIINCFLFLFLFRFVFLSTFSACVVSFRCFPFFYCLLVSSLACIHYVAVCVCMIFCAVCSFSHSLTHMARVESETHNLK